MNWGGISSLGRAKRAGFTTVALTENANIMKVSKESMKKLGFVLYTDMGYWQHETFHEVCFTELPSWDKIVFNAFQNGRKHGREETQTDIKEALGIY